MKIEYRLPLIAVKSVEVSKKFYGDLFDQKVVMDFGENVTFSGGFAIQEDFDRIAGLPEKPSFEKSYDMELYFETDDFDGFIEKMGKYPDVEYVHMPKKYDWQQRVVRIFDPDGHIIELGESMAYIAKRFLNEGKTPEETAALIQHPLEFVLACKNGEL